ncbi:L-aminoadipate-semialdehyde dehydrogenase-phosphopantetheinyl transferase [Diachasmimorpha longicaudata]|uniref:L-aminoadipate-semialdehyde dehydrogenase-phosphopantetheinyl transferase n=1 Tax=Diachasmimorpha longicaudata TaxID=58733 RepID=UPI0030B90EE5
MIKTSTPIKKMTKMSVRWAFNWGEWSPSEKELKLAVSCLQLEEKARLAKFVFRKDLKASLIGRLLMRKFINDSTKIPYDKIELERDKTTGRPILKNPSTPVSFNVSHQGNYTVLAGESEDLKIGVDVMKLEYTGGKALPEFFRIMNRNFSSSEWNEIRGAPGTPESKQIAMFGRHWALKESYVKALSVGITVDLRELDFQTQSDLRSDKVVADTILYERGVRRNWNFEETLIDSDHCVAVALEIEKQKSHPQNNHFVVIKFEDLMKFAIPLHPEDDDFCKNYFGKAERP